MAIVSVLILIRLIRKTRASVLQVMLTIETECYVCKPWILASIETRLLESVTFVRSTFSGMMRETVLSTNVLFGKLFILITSSV